MTVLVVATAVRDRGADAVAEAVRAYGLEHGLAPTDDPFEGVESVEVLAPTDGGRGARLRWPAFFGGALPAARALSESLATVVSTVDTYEEALWRHVLCDRGQVVDRYTSDRGYFGPDEDPGPAWDGDPDAVAATLGVDAATVAAYYGSTARRRGLGRRRRGGRGRAGRAHPDDRFERDDPWVVTDLWRRLGIAYPEPGDPADVVIDYPRPLGDVLPYERTDF